MFTEIGFLMFAYHDKALHWIEQWHPSEYLKTREPCFSEVDRTEWV